MKHSNRFILLILITLFFSVTAFADSWALPKKRTICSKNNKFCLKIIPKNLKSQLAYFKDKVDGKENAGANKKVKNNYCKGIYYSRDENGKLHKKWKIKLVNEVSPVDVLISDDGKYVVTFDNWHSVGYGDDVVVIYETSKGQVINKLGLSDFLTETDIFALPKSVSSIWWGGKHLIDYAKQNLILQITKGKRIYNKNADYFPVRIDLKTGKVLDEIRDHLPSLQYSIKPLAQINKLPERVNSSADNILCQKSQEYQNFSSTEFLKKAITQEKIVYPVAAIAVRATGIIIVEVFVNENGDVDCVSPISGHPLLKPIIVRSVKKWKFEKKQFKYYGQIAFEGKIQLVSPDGKIIK